MSNPSPRRSGRPAGTGVIYQRIAVDLRRRLAAREWSPGAALPSLRSLAARYGVSNRTTALAIRALKEEGWVAALPRRRLVASHPETSLTPEGNLILEVLSSPLQGRILGADLRAIQLGIHKAAGDLFAPLLVAHHADLRKVLPLRLLELSPRGLVLVGGFRDALLKRYEKLGLPVVLVDNPGERWKLHSIAVDNANAALDAVQRLAARGHRCIAFLRRVHFSLAQVDSDSRERQEGFLRGMRKAGLEPSKDSVYNAFATDSPSSANLQRLLSADPPFTAALAADGILASLLLQAAESRGMRVPRDFSIACFQGRPPDEAIFSGPRIDFEALASGVSRLLLAPMNAPVHLRHPATWFEGSTVGPCAR